MKKRLKSSKKKKKEKIDMHKEKSSDTEIENIQFYIINNIIKI